MGKFAREIGLSVQQTRTAITNMENNKQITRKTTNKFQVVSLVKWDELQNSELEDNNQINKYPNKQLNKQITSKLTTSKELKEIKKIKKEEFINNLNLNASLEKIELIDSSFSELFINYWTKDDKGKMLFEHLPYFDFEKQIELFHANRQKILTQKSKSHGNKSTESKSAQSDARKRKILDAIDKSSCD